MDATSTSVDGDLWPTEPGRRYLMAQRETIARRHVRIRRLFIVDAPEQNGLELQRLRDDQENLGIQVRVLAAPTCGA
jgi:hypothetical protein